MTEERVANDPSKINLLSLASIVLAAIAAASFFGLGTAVVAVFAVGAAHGALAQIRERRERGNALAYIALAAGYGMAAYALVNTVPYWVALASQGGQ